MWQALQTRPRALLGILALPFIPVLRKVSARSLRVTKLDEKLGPNTSPNSPTAPKGSTTYHQPPPTRFWVQRPSSNIIRIATNFVDYSEGQRPGDGHRANETSEITRMLGMVENGKNKGAALDKVSWRFHLLSV